MGLLSLSKLVPLDVSLSEDESLAASAAGFWNTSRQNSLCELSLCLPSLAREVALATTASCRGAATAAFRLFSTEPHSSARCLRTPCSPGPDIYSCFTFGEAAPSAPSASSPSTRLRLRPLPVRSSIEFQSRSSVVKSGNTRHCAEAFHPSHTGGAGRQHEHKLRGQRGRGLLIK